MKTSSSPTPLNWHKFFKRDKTRHLHLEQNVSFPYPSAQGSPSFWAGVKRSPVRLKSLESLFSPPCLLHPRTHHILPTLLSKWLSYLLLTTLALWDTGFFSHGNISLLAGLFPSDFPLLKRTLHIRLNTPSKVHSQQNPWDVKHHSMVFHCFSH